MAESNLLDKGAAALVSLLWEKAKAHVGLIAPGLAVVLEAALWIVNELSAYRAWDVLFLAHAFLVLGCLIVVAWSWFRTSPRGSTPSTGQHPGAASSTQTSSPPTAQAEPERPASPPSDLVAGLYENLLRSKSGTETGQTLEPDVSSHTSRVDAALRHWWKFLWEPHALTPSGLRWLLLGHLGALALLLWLSGAVHQRLTHLEGDQRGGIYQRAGSMLWRELAGSLPHGESLLSVRRRTAYWRNQFKAESLQPHKTTGLARALGENGEPRAYWLSLVGGEVLLGGSEIGLTAPDDALKDPSKLLLLQGTFLLPQLRLAGGAGTSSWCRAVANSGALSVTPVQRWGLLRLQDSYCERESLETDLSDPLLWMKAARMPDPPKSRRQKHWLHALAERQKPDQATALTLVEERAILRVQTLEALSREKDKGAEHWNQLRGDWSTAGLAPPDSPSPAPGSPQDAIQDRIRELAIKLIESSGPGSEDLAKRSLDELLPDVRRALAKITGLTWEHLELLSLERRLRESRFEDHRLRPSDPVESITRRGLLGHTTLWNLALYARWLRESPRSMLGALGAHTTIEGLSKLVRSGVPGKNSIRSQSSAPFSDCDESLVACLKSQAIWERWRDEVKNELAMALAYTLSRDRDSLVLLRDYESLEHEFVKILYLDSSIDSAVGDCHLLDAALCHDLRLSQAIRILSEPMLHLIRDQKPGETRRAWIRSHLEQLPDPRFSALRTRATALAVARLVDQDSANTEGMKHWREDLSSYRSTPDPDLASIWEATVNPHFFLLYYDVLPDLP